MIDHFILERDLYGEMDVDKLKELLNHILNVQTRRGKQGPSLFIALTQVLFPSKEQESLQFFQSASMWFCQTLSHAVFTQIARSRMKQLQELPRRFEHVEKTSDEFKRN